MLDSWWNSNLWCSMHTNKAGIFIWYEYSKLEKEEAGKGILTSGYMGHGWDGGPAKLLMQLFWAAFSCLANNWT